MLISRNVMIACDDAVIHIQQSYRLFSRYDCIPNTSSIIIIKLLKTSKTFLIMLQHWIGKTKKQKMQWRNTDDKRMSHHFVVVSKKQNQLCQTFFCLVFYEDWKSMSSNCLTDFLNKNFGIAKVICNTQIHILQYIPHYNSQL